MHNNGGQKYVHTALSRVLVVESFECTVENVAGSRPRPARSESRTKTGFGGLRQDTRVRRTRRDGTRVPTSWNLVRLDSGFGSYGAIVQLFRDSDSSAETTVTMRIRIGKVTVKVLRQWPQPCKQPESHLLLSHDVQLKYERLKSSARVRDRQVHSSLNTLGASQEMNGVTCV